jgi:antitoxin component YwqK of YwqJK toxin-antitoxin module
MRSLILILFALISFRGISQTVAVQIKEMNLVYKGIDNPINIAVEGVLNEDLVISTNNLLSYANGNLRAESKKYGPGFIYIGKKANNDTLWIDTVKLRIRSLPSPTAQLGGIPNDGLPKGIAAVQAQRSLIATMGNGFAYNIQYKIISFKCIVAYQDKQPVIFSGNSGALTTPMIDAIAKIRGGDRLLFEAIRAEEKNYGFKANLPPVIIQLNGGQSSKNNTSYARIYNIDTKIDTVIYDVNDIIKYHLGLENGIVNFFSLTKSGYICQTSHINNKTVTSVTTANDFGIKTESHIRLDSNSWTYQEFYPDGKIKLKTNYVESEVLKGSESITKCIDIAAYWKSLNNDANKECLNGPFVYDIVELYLTKKIAATHSFTAYYPNGSVRLVGKLVKLEGMEEPEIPSMCGSGITYYQYSDHTVMDGKWILYSETGKVIEVREYKMGTLIN